MVDVKLVDGRAKRVLWLLNHKTLMPWEVPFLTSLGCEVFTPKILPPEGQFRSAYVDFQWDHSLTINDTDLQRLNSFDFYSSEWPIDIVNIVNDHFDCVFFMPFGRQPQQVLRHVRRTVVLRAFGLYKDVTYSQWLADEFGPEVFIDLRDAGEDFIFGQAYDNLADVESEAIAARAMHLPMGVPKHLWQLANTWTGQSGQVLFFCPNIATIPEHRDQYKDFVSAIGNNPYVVVGPQSEPIDDPNVIGKVDDAELVRLLQTCAIVHYPSREPRHILYSPVEAAIIGAPILFFDDSLFARLAGVVTSHEQPPVQRHGGDVGRVLHAAASGDKDEIAYWQTRSRAVSEAFADDACLSQWTAFVDELGGRQTRLNGTVRPLPSRQWMTAPSRLPLPTAQLDVGIELSNEPLPDAVVWYGGLSAAEQWGRWTDGNETTITLATPQRGPGLLTLTGGAHASNIGADVEVFVDGLRAGSIGFDTEPWSPGECRLPVTMTRDETTVVLRLPAPHVLPDVRRRISLGLTKVAISPLDEVAPAMSAFVSFRADSLPDIVLSVRGVAPPEGWGRWSLGRKVSASLRPVRGPVQLSLSAGAYGENLGTPIGVLVNGVSVGSMTFDSPPWAPSTQTLRIDQVDLVHEICFEIAHPATDLDRPIGIGLAELRLSPAPRPAVIVLQRGLRKIGVVIARAVSRVRRRTTR
jgi:hypothetical protein